MSSTLSHIGKYELRTVIARTATSFVYDGWDCDIARRVAVKTVPLSTLEDGDMREALVRFKRGVQAAGQLTHPNIINIHDYGETDEHAYIVMEFVDGPTLKQLLEGGQHFDVRSICKVMDGILDGLQYSHDRGVVHRDMKPANIMFTKDNRVKITDFGIARLEDNNMTQTGMVIGTPAYMSPEQIMGDKVDWRSDIYSTGVVLYHMITGARPYEGNLATIMNKVLNSPIPRPSSMSPISTPELDQVVTRAMAKKPEQRFHSADEFNAALHAVLERADPGYRPVTAPRVEALMPPGLSSRGKFRGRYPPLVGAVIALVALVSGSTWLFRHEFAPDSKGPTPTTHQSDSTPLVPAGGQSIHPPAPPLANTGLAGDNEKAFPATGPVMEPPPEPPATGKQTLQTAQSDSSGNRSGEGGAGIASIWQRPSAEPPPVSIPEYLRQPPPAPAPSPPPLAPVPKGPVTRQTLPRRDTASGKVTSQLAERAPQDDTVKNLIDGLRRGVPPPTPLADPPDSDHTLQLPPEYAETSMSGAIGLVCETVTSRTARDVGLVPPRGLLVTGATAGFPAALSGIRWHDVLLKINGAEMRDISKLRSVAQSTPAGRTVPVEIFRDRKVITVQLNVDQLR